MNYTIVLSRKAEKAIHKASVTVVKRLTSHIDELVTDPRPSGCIKLTDSQNRYRIRVGDWRILYSVEDDTRLVTIHRIARREKAYE